jgi:hypothetical protein
VVAEFIGICVGLEHTIRVTDAVRRRVGLGLSNGLATSNLVEVVHSKCNVCALSY